MANLRVTSGKAALSGILVLLLFAVFVWPTLYTPVAIKYNDTQQFSQFVAARQNRITGQVEWLPVLGAHFVPGGR